MQIISPDEGDRADFPGLGTRYLLRRDETDEQFALIEHTIPPRTLAAPTHVHEREDEFSYVLAGRVGVQVGDEEARLLELISPPAFAAYFVDMAPVLSGDGPLDPERLRAIREKYGLSMDIESRERLIEEHGLKA